MATHYQKSPLVGLGFGLLQWANSAIVVILSVSHAIYKKLVLQASRGFFSYSSPLGDHISVVCSCQYKLPAALALARPFFPYAANGGTIMPESRDSGIRSYHKINGSYCKKTDSGEKLLKMK